MTYRQGQRDKAIWAVSGEQGYRGKGIGVKSRGEDIRVYEKRLRGPCIGEISWAKGTRARAYGSST